MSITYIPVALRERVRKRAGHVCEYCLLAEIHGHLTFEADHIIAEKHGGKSVFRNLAWACFEDNHFKGSDIASRDPVSGRLTPLFNPRKQKWEDHFRLVNAEIVPLTAVGRVTERILKLNLPHRMEVRAILIAVGQYPPLPPSG